MEDQIALLDHLGIERAVWGGTSVAGPIALRAALRHPGRVSALVLISTQAGPERVSLSMRRLLASSRRRVERSRH